MTIELVLSRQDLMLYHPMQVISERACLIVKDAQNMANDLAEKAEEALKTMAKAGEKAGDAFKAVSRNIPKWGEDIAFWPKSITQDDGLLDGTSTITATFECSNTTTVKHLVSRAAASGCRVSVREQLPTYQILKTDIENAASGFIGRAMTQEVMVQWERTMRDMVDRAYAATNNIWAVASEWDSGTAATGTNLVYPRDAIFWGDEHLNGPTAATNTTITTTNNFTTTVHNDWFDVNIQANPRMPVRMNINDPRWPYLDHTTPFEPWRGNYGIETPQDKIRRRFKEQMQPKLLNHNGKTIRASGRGADFSKAQPNEIVALQLLKNLTSADAFRKYLKYGFVNVTGPSGLVYKIARKNHLISVYHSGKLVSTLCVYLADSSIPPTDEVIAKMIIAECDEQDIWRRANINWHGVPDRFKRVTRKEFTEKTLLQLVA